MNYHIELKAYRIIGWVGLLFCLCGAIAALVEREFIVSIFFATFSTLGLYIILGAGHYEFNDTKLTHHSYFGTWEILWSELSKVEIGEADGSLVLHGTNKRFTISPPNYWSGKDKNDALVFIFKKFEDLGLILQPSKSAAYKTMKNTRVSK